MQIELTKEEHFALTGVLRSGFTHGTLDCVGLLDLYKRLQAPYMAELQRRTGYASGNAFMLPAFHLATKPVTLHGLKETSMEVNWYEWNKEAGDGQG